MGRRIAVAALLALAGATGLIGTGSGAADSAVGERPNIVVLMTDDQTPETLRVMPKTAGLLAERGVEFANNFVSNSTCCPSRATYLTGQYSHNNGVIRSGPPLGGYGVLDESQTLPGALQGAGYYTSHIGKYLNGYGVADPTAIPPGWDEWRGSLDPSTYSMYGYTLNENGVLTTYGDPDVEDPSTYQTDVYARKAVDFIARRAPSAEPFFLSLAPLAPHGEADLGNEPDNVDTPGPRAAPRDEGAFASEPQPRTASYDEADVSDKPSEVRAMPRLNGAQLTVHQGRYRDRLESLLAVDDMVASIVEALRASGELGETLFVFTSDNGLLLGEHRVHVRKELPYEESIRIPLIIRGPGVPEGRVREQPAANVDLVPTILDYARADAPVPPDGRSLRPLIADGLLEPGRAILIENWCEKGQDCFDPASPTIPRYQAVRTPRYLYAEYRNGERELYDLDRDPFELESRHADPAYAQVRESLDRLLDRLRDCAGAECESRPRLDPRLVYESGPDGCVDGPVRLRFGGADAGELIGVEAFIGSERVAADTQAPIGVSIPRERLSPGGTDLRANATVLDSRAVSLDVRVPPLCRAADLSVDVADTADPVRVGSRFDYSIAVANGGPRTAPDLRVENTLPAEVELIQATVAGGGGSCSSPGPNSVECAVGDLPRGGEAKVRIAVLAQQPAMTLDLVSVRASLADPDASNNSDAEQTVIAEDAPPTCRALSATIFGAEAADTLVGTDQPDVIFGGGGDDLISGREGEDLICGGAGSDRIAGSWDSDTLAAGEGDDRVRGNHGDDALAGMAGRDDLGGGVGDDVLVGGDGADSCLGGTGQNVLRACE